MTTCPCEEKAAEALWRAYWRVQIDGRDATAWPENATHGERREYRAHAAIARAAMGHVCDDCPERKNNDA